MTPCKILAVLGLALAGPFSIAQEIVERGNQKNPYEPPVWISRLATPELVFTPEIDFYVGGDESRKSYGRFTAGNGIKYFCGLEKNNDGVLLWRFCEM